MKSLIKISIILSLVILSALAVKAQEKVWSIGPEVGITFSKYGGDAVTNDIKVGAMGGLFVTYSIQNTFGVTGKVLYYQKGAAINGSDTKQTLNYIEIPVIGRFFLVKEGKFRPNVFIGPSFGFLTSVTNKVGSGDRVTVDDWQSNYNTFDMGATGGLGLNMLISNETYLIIDARYTHGFSDITKGAGSINNDTVAISAGISFGF